MADKTQKKIDIKKFYIYIVALISSIITFIFFYISNEIIKEEKIVKPKEDIYEIAKKEAIKLGRLEPD